MGAVMAHVGNHSLRHLVKLREIDSAHDVK